MDADNEGNRVVNCTEYGLCRPLIQEPYTYELLFFIELFHQINPICERETGCGILEREGTWYLSWKMRIKICVLIKTGWLSVKWPKLAHSSLTCKVWLQPGELNEVVGAAFPHRCADGCMGLMGHVILPHPDPASQNLNHLPLWMLCRQASLWTPGNTEAWPLLGKMNGPAEKTGHKKMTEYPSCLINTVWMAQAINALTKQGGRYLLWLGGGGNGASKAIFHRMYLN